jgi:alpha-ketoglutarate-dependent 2,4-dichlorophenoxyacetate dioxygenase
MRAAYDALDPEIKAEIEDPDHRALAAVFPRPRSSGWSSLGGGAPGANLTRSSAVNSVNPGAGSNGLRARSYRARNPATIRLCHTWRQHDLVMWDNRQTMHRARRYKETSEVRDMRRTTLQGDGPTTLQMAVA